MVRSIAARSEQRWRASPGVVKALLEQRDIVAADAQAHARTPVASSAVASSAFDGKVVPTQRDRLDDEDVAILGRRAEEIIPDLSQLMSVHTVVKVKECVRRWRAKVQSQLPPPERKSIARMGQFVADADNVLVTTCVESVRRAMNDPDAVRCPHLLACDETLGGFWRDDDDGAKFVTPHSVRTIRVNAHGTPLHRKHVQCARCHAAVQALRVRSVAVCPQCDGSYPRSAMARYAHDWDGDPETLSQICLFCDKNNQRTARESEERFGVHDRVRTATRAMIEPSCGYLDVADVPFMETILHRNVASRWDGIVCENVSIEPDKRWRLGVYTDDNDPGASTNKANTALANPNYGDGEWEFTRQGYDDGLNGVRPDWRWMGDDPVVDSTFPRVGALNPSPNLLKKTYVGARQEVRPNRRTSSSSRALVGQTQ